MMTSEDREQNERWLKQVAALEADCDDPTGGAVPYFARRFPIPDTRGLTPAEAEAVMAKWRAEVNAAMTFNAPSRATAFPDQVRVS